MSRLSQVRTVSSRSRKHTLSLCSLALCTLMYATLNFVQAAGADEEQGITPTATIPVDNAGECGSPSPWCNTFYFGLQLMPDYDGEDGTYSGLDEQALFAHFNFESIRKNERTDSFGFDVRLHQSGAVSVENTDTSGSSTPGRFNEVADTLDLSGYYIRTLSEESTLLFNDEDIAIGSRSGSRYGWKFVGGGRTRESSVENEDTLSTYFATGFTYAYYKSVPDYFVKEDTGETSYFTSSPDGEFDFGFAYYEDWAGRRQDMTDLEDWRVVFRGVYQLRQQWFLGVLANGGKGPDEVSVFFGARKSVSDLLKFMGLGD